MRPQIPSIRLKPAERKLLQAAAEADGLSLTEFVRKEMLILAVSRLESRDDLVNAVYQEYPEDPPWMPVFKDDDWFVLLQFSDEQMDKVQIASRVAKANNGKDWALAAVLQAAQWPNESFEKLRARADALRIEVEQAKTQLRAALGADANDGRSLKQLIDDLELDLQVEYERAGPP